MLCCAYYDVRIPLEKPSTKQYVNMDANIIVVSMLNTYYLRKIEITIPKPVTTAVINKTAPTAAVVLVTPSVPAAVIAAELSAANEVAEAVAMVEATSNFERIVLNILFPLGIIKKVKFLGRFT